MQNSQDNTLDLKQITTQCMDSPGYLLFAAFLTPKRDGEGQNIIDFQYRRYHLGLADAKTAARELKKFITKEIDDLMSEYQEGDGENDKENQEGI